MSQFLDSNLFYSLMAGLTTAVAAGFLGVFMIMKRMSLVSDALSHVALPGVALALIFHLNPFLGAFAFLLLAAFLIAGLERRTNLPIDAIVGVLFSAALAAGILLTPEPELLEALFGSLTQITPLEAWFTMVISLLVVVIAVLVSRHLMFSVVAPDLGHASKLHTKTANLIFLIMLATVVALGIKFVGTLLMGTLTIIPAASAKNVAKNLYSFGIISMTFAALSVILGMAAVYLWGIAAGPAVIIASAGIFLVSLLVKRPA